MRRTRLILGVALLLGLLLVVALTAVRASPLLAMPDRPTVHHPVLAPLPQAASGFRSFSEVNTVPVDGVQRTYRSFVTALPAGRLPLLAVLHGRGQSDSSVLAMTGFIGLAQQGQAVLLVLDGQQRSWNAGHGCCGFAGAHQTPDVPFVAATVADALRRWPIDARRGVSRRVQQRWQARLQRGMCASQAVRSGSDLRGGTAVTLRTRHLGGVSHAHCRCRRPGIAFSGEAGWAPAVAVRAPSGVVARTTVPPMQFVAGMVRR